MENNHTSSRAQRIVKGVGNVSLMLVILSLVSYLLRIVFARVLTPYEYGLFYAVLTFVMFLLIFRDFGFKTALTKFVAEYASKSDFGKVKTVIVSSFLFQLVSSLLLIIFLLIFADTLAQHYFKDNASIGILYVMALYVFFSMVGGVIHSMLYGFQDVRWYSLTEVLRLLFVLILFVPFSFFFSAALAAAWAFVGGVILTFTLQLAGLAKYRHVWQQPLSNFWPTSKQLWKFSLPVVFTGIGNKVIAHMDTLVLTFFVSLADVGIYNVVLPTALLFLFFGKAVSTVLFPFASQLHSEGKIGLLVQRMDSVYTVPLAVTLPLMIIVASFPDVFFSFLFGEEYAGGIWPFRILLIGVFFYIVATINNSVITSVGKPATVTKIIVLSAAVNVVLNFLLIPSIGLLGAAGATTASYFLAFLLSTKNLQSLWNFNIPWRKWSYLLLLGVFMLILQIGLLKLIPSTGGLIFASVISAVTFASLVIILNIVPFEDIKQLLRHLVDSGKK